MALDVSVDDLIDEVEMRMLHAIEAFQRDLAAFRTGKASPGLVENIVIDYYGAQTRLRDLAGISAPEPRLLVVQPWDASALGAIEKAIRASNIGINPVSDGRVVRLPVPELSEERRRDLTKQVKKRCEEARIEIRAHRREANDLLKKSQKSGAITEDDLKVMGEDVQKLTTDYTKQVDDASAAKEKELMAV
ncbi:MAG: ribosome recycling factor [Rhodothermales bacterium]|jgi:ribosome recycling factor